MKEPLGTVLNSLILIEDQTAPEEVFTCQIWMW